MGEAAEATMLVRIRPDKRGQFVTKRYMAGGQIYAADNGWYEVEAERAERLKEIHLHEDPDAPLLFDVVTREEAEHIDERAKVLEEKAPATRPHRVAPERLGLAATPQTGTTTTADLPKTEVLDPDPEGKELQDDEGLAPVGRVAESGDPDKPSARTRSRK